MPPTSYGRTPVTAPGPAGGDMLRSIGLIRRDPLGFLHRMWVEHGDVVQFPIPSPPTYMVSSPAGVRHVLVGNARNYGKQTIQYRSLSLLTGLGLLTSDAEQWRMQRRLVQPAFHPSVLPSVGGHSEQAAADLAEDWQVRDGQVVDVDEAMMHAALDVVGRSLFGSDLSGDAGEITRATLEGLDVVIARARVPVPVPAWLPTPNNRRLAASRAILDGAVRAMVDARVASPGQHGDMLDLLMQARGEDGEQLDPGQIRDQIVTFIVAGHETVASAMTWAWHLLGTHQDVRGKLEAELDALGCEPTFADLAALPYTRAVYDEALRLYPPAWLITRQARGADTVDGVHIPEGALLIMSPYLLHRHPAVCDRPEEFRPERFEQEDRRLRQSFIPFGAGPRLCIGRDFAYAEGVLLLARLARRFRLSPVPGHAVSPLPVVTIRPREGLPMRIAVR